MTRCRVREGSRWGHAARSRGVLRLDADAQPQEHQGTSGLWRLRTCNGLRNAALHFSTSISARGLFLPSSTSGRCFMHFGEGNETCAQLLPVLLLQPRGSRRNS
eukprot:scaffold98766_cov18-Tisochrysis_lutea.AAC.1